MAKLPKGTLVVSGFEIDTIALINVVFQRMKYLKESICLVSGHEVPARQSRRVSRRAAQFLLRHRQSLGAQGRQRRSALVTSLRR